MADIVERLRERHCSEPHCWALRHEAADEIKRLRAEVERLRALLRTWETTTYPLVGATHELLSGKEEVSRD